MTRRMIAVIGGRQADTDLLSEAEKVGRLIAEHGAVLICGGLGGVMKAASKGARSIGGLTVGILPQEHKGDANEFIDIPVATGLGIGRNIIIARTADALIAVGGEYGTLSEIAFALQMGKPVAGIRTWEVKGMIGAAGASEAVEEVFRALSSG